MAHHLAKPYSILSYFIAILGGFFIGIAFAAFTEAGKGQMLAGGAIVFFYGIVGAGIALCLAFFLAFKTNRKVIISMNTFYMLAMVFSFAYLRHIKQKKDHERQQKQQEFKQQNKPTQTASTVNYIAPLKTPKDETKTVQTNKTGLGMFIPNFHKNKTLYFYGNLTDGKSVQEHSPIDSVTFKQREYGGFDIATAPPWLVPDHLKLDYDMLYFKATSISYDFIEVIVNTTNNRTAFVDRYAGKVYYWPEFLLAVHSVEFPQGSNYKVYAKPFKNAGVISTSYSFMKPLKIKNNWMYVELWNDSFKKVGNGWIQWRDKEKLLIIYSLLS